MSSPSDPIWLTYAEVRVTNRIILVSGGKWKRQRQAGHAALTSSLNLQHFLQKILPRHISKLSIPLDGVAVSGSAVDFQEVAYEYAMAVFGEMAYNVSLTSNFLSSIELF